MRRNLRVLLWTTGCLTFASCATDSADTIPALPQAVDISQNDAGAMDTAVSDISPATDTTTGADTAEKDAAVPRTDTSKADTTVADTAMVDTDAPDMGPEDTAPTPQCATDEDCVDDNLCTSETCLGSGKCVYVAVPGCCQQPSDCNETIEPCETWLCVANQCTVNTDGCASQTVTVSTVSGFNLQGYQDGPLATAMFGRPWDMTIDEQGTIYVTDIMTHAVRTIKEGIVSTIAGGSNTQKGKWNATSTPWSFSGDVDGPTDIALFNMPSGIWVEPGTHTVFVLDMYNQRLKTIQNDVVQTIAGGNGQGFAEGPALDSAFNYPTDILGAPTGGYYIADSGNHRIRHLSADQSTMTTLIGTGVQGYVDGPAATAQLYEPTGLALDGTGALVIADYKNQRIRRYADGNVTTLAGTGLKNCPNGTDEKYGCSQDGSVDTASIGSPISIDYDNNGALIIVQQVQNRIAKFENNTIENIAGTGTKGNADGLGALAQFNDPTSVVCLPSGDLWITDSQNQGIRQLSFD